MRFFPWSANRDDSGVGPDAATLEWYDSVKRGLEGIDQRIGALESAPTALRELERIKARVDQQAISVDTIETTLAPLANWRAEIMLAVSDGIERVDRAERRVRAVVRSARKELADAGYEHPGLEAEHAELRLVDGDGGDEEELPDVPDDVATDGDGPSSVAGVSRAQLMRARGM